MNWYEAFERGCARLELDWSTFRFSGSDAKKFLNGLVSNDVLKMTRGSSLSACLLSPKGLLRAYFLLHDLGEVLLALCPPESAGNFSETMKKMIVLSESKFEDVTKETCCFLFAGPAAEAHVGLVENYLTACVPWPRLSPSARIAVAPQSMRMKILLGTARGPSSENFEVWRVERGLPVFGVDMNDSTIPLEARLDDAISFDKGCYMGQETISRVHNLGHLNKILVQLKINAAEPPAAGSAVLGADGKEIGKVTSAVVSPRFGGIVALATLRVEQSKLGTVVGVASGRGSHRAEVVGP